MKTFLQSFFASLMALLFLVFLVLAIIAVHAPSRPGIKDHSYLVIDLYGAIPEYDPPLGPMESLLGGEFETLHRILGNLKKAKVDDRIEGVIIKISASSYTGYAKLQEIRNALKDVRSAGKKVYAFSDFMDRKTYYLAAACDSIYMPDSGYLFFTGFSMTSQHIRGTLDKLGIQPNLHRIKDYKSAAEMLTRKNMSPKVRENRAWMIDEYWDMFAEALETDRGLTEQKLTKLMQHALFTTEEAKGEGLVDGLMYWNQLENHLKHENNNHLRTVSQLRYAEENPKKLGLKGKKKIAVIHAQGSIGGRHNRIDPVFGIMMGHESLRTQLKKAREDDDISAVIFRVDSPGGESLTSHLIAHDVEITAQSKPVVVSMVDVAASGGYTIAYRGTRLVANPMSITGSIGSISGKFNMKGLYDKLGLTYDFITRGPMALFFSEYRNFTSEEWQRFTENHWIRYNQWLEDIAEYRGKTFQETETLAHGRVWTGRQAAANGLVDTLGGLDAAVELAKNLTKIPEQEKVTLVHYPKKKGFLSLLFEGGNVQSIIHGFIYRWIRTDVAETYNLMLYRPWSMMDPITIE